MSDLKHPPKSILCMTQENLSFNVREGFYGLHTNSPAEQNLVHDIKNKLNIYAKRLMEDIKEQLEGVIVSEHEKCIPHDPVS